LIRLSFAVISLTSESQPARTDNCPVSGLSVTDANAPFLSFTVMVFLEASFSGFRAILEKSNFWLWLRLNAAFHIMI
jgi:hypothetical protein